MSGRGATPGRSPGSSVASIAIGATAMFFTADAKARQHAWYGGGDVARRLVIAGALVAVTLAASSWPTMGPWAVVLMVWRTAATTAAAGLLAVSALAAPSNAEAATAPRTVPAAASQATTPESVQRFGACLAGGAPGDLLVLMDRSGSLKDSDPDNARVMAPSTWSSNSPTSARNSLNLEVAVAGFDTTFEKVTGWMPVTTGRNDLLASIGTFAEANRGVDTDYWNAMSGARRELAARGAGADGRCSGSSCSPTASIVVHPRWGPPGNQGPRRASSLRPGQQAGHGEGPGRGDPSRPEGHLPSRWGGFDQVRLQDITTFGIGLSGEAKPNSSSSAT